MSCGMGFDLSSIIGLKMVSAITKKGDINLANLMIIQQLTSGKPIQISDVIKAKLMDSICKTDDIESLPLDKLMMYKMFESGTIDVNQLIQMKMTMKLLGNDFMDLDDTKSDNKD